MFGQHAGFIIPAYGITAIALVGMTAAICIVYRSRKQELKTLEDSGVSRRSSEKQ